MDVSQKVEKVTAQLSPDINYSYRKTDYPFKSVPESLTFVRAGKDYTLLLKEEADGNETKRSGDKSFPVFTIHFRSDNIPVFRDMISEENTKAVTDAYLKEKKRIDEILGSAPDNQ
jgi:hypothetical protein